ncbi:SixA phosphatase family protein [Fimbriiglobus ruber]|uniref:SixA phosphatase family protein n=1 Tax=Fimbriiglobus ruber TaxID=1908690 RepID=UPI00137B09A2|nr:histidine phosphatase family protein [Fimbriiglobus ruber]
MRIILVRHAEAVNLWDDGVETDFNRHLTPKGQEQAARLAAALGARNVAPGAILTSPFVRAVQTAEPLMRLLPGEQAAPPTSDLLAAGELRKKKLTRAVNGLGHEVVILVGHMPDMAVYTAWLIGSTASGIAFDKGAAALISFEGGASKGDGVLEWLITPEWCSSIS